MKAPTFKTYAEEIAYKRGFVDGDSFAEKRIIKLLEMHDKETRAGNTDMAIKYRAAVLSCISIVRGEN